MATFGLIKRYMLWLLALCLSLAAAGSEEKTFTLVLDAGHGGKDPGAKGTAVLEKEINLKVALAVGRLVEKEHPEVRVVYTRTTDCFVELDERANIANRNKADLFVSVHTNSADRAASASGTETYALGLARTDENLAVAMRENSAILLEDDYEQRYEGFDPNTSESYIIFEFMQNKHLEQSIHFASEVQKCFKEAKRPDRGVRQAGFLVLRKTGMPSVLIELGFISNRREEQFMASEAGQQQLARSIADAFGIYKEAYDKKLLGAAPRTVPAKTEVLAEAKPEARKAEGEAGGTVYKVQIFTSDRKLPPGSRYFKGYKDIGCFQEKGLYKYTLGESADIREMKALRRKVLKDFKDAFVVEFRNGKKVI